MLTLHLAALATYVATCLYIIFALLPCAVAFRDTESRRRFLARGFRVQSPLAIGSLGLIVMTGAFAITETKARLGGLFFVILARPLAIKLILTFTIINIATYMSFGLAHRVVRAHQEGLPPDARWLASTARRLWIATTVALAFVAVTTWLATEMAPLLDLRPSPSHRDASRDRPGISRERKVVLAKSPPDLSS